MNFKEAWDIYQKAVDSGHKLWGYFSTVSLAVVGYIVAWDKIAWTWPMYLLVAAGYGLFAYGNRKVLLVAQREIVDAGSAVEAVKSTLTLSLEAPEKKLTVTTITVDDVSLYHSLLIGVVLAAIALTWATTKLNSPGPSKPAIPPCCCCQAAASPTGSASASLSGR